MTVSKVIPIDPLADPLSAVKRDPVAAAIEDFLAAEMLGGRGRLSKQTNEEGVSVSFSSESAIGPNFDIAFVRLAFLILDDPILARGLRDALRDKVEMGNQ